MTRKLLLSVLATIAIVTLFTVARAPAQDRNPQNEIAFSAQLVRANPNFNRPDFRFNQGTDQIGVVVGLSHYFGKSSFGITGEVGASFKSTEKTDSSLVTVMAGPTIGRRSGVLQPSIRALAGVGRLAAANQQLTVKFDKSNTGFAYDVGGALDARLSRHVRLRLISVDYLGTRTLGQTVNYARVGAGLVFGL